MDDLRDSSRRGLRPSHLGQFSQQRNSISSQYDVADPLNL